MADASIHDAAWAETALAHAARLLEGFRGQADNARRIATVAGLIAGAFGAGNKAMICGNGGSSADALHFAEELTGRFRKERPALPAIACTDVGHITCVANDYGYEAIFERWVQALGRPGDVLIVLSTSGNSVNVTRAVAAAKARGMTSVALLGKTGGTLRGVCDHEWIVGGPDDPADRIQEIHMLVLHALIEGIERRMFPALYR
jgi:D-sedoheptulose 7-phosphate isomerase